jgi:hypothetical protein
MLAHPRGKLLSRASSSWQAPFSTLGSGSRRGAALRDHLAVVSAQDVSAQDVVMSPRAWEHRGPNQERHGFCVSVPRPVPGFKTRLLRCSMNLGTILRN